MKPNLLKRHLDGCHPELKDRYNTYVGLLIHITAADIISEILSIVISPETTTKGDLFPHLLHALKVHRKLWLILSAAVIQILAMYSSKFIVNKYNG